MPRCISLHQNIILNLSICLYFSTISESPPCTDGMKSLSLDIPPVAALAPPLKTRSASVSEPSSEDKVTKRAGPLRPCLRVQRSTSLKEFDEEQVKYSLLFLLILLVLF